jgi:hypothetical protein
MYEIHIRNRVLKNVEQIGKFVKWVVIYLHECSTVAHHKCTDRVG